MYIDDINTLKMEIKLLSGALINLIDVISDMEDEIFDLNKQVCFLKKRGAK